MPRTPVVACCDVAVHGVMTIFNPSQLEMYGGGGTDIGKGIQWFADGGGGAGGDGAHCHSGGRVGPEESARAP